MYCVAFLTLALVSTLGGCAEIPGVKTSEPFDHAEILDKSGNYILFWNVNDTHVTFETHVKTQGYVGFGFSDNGNMFPGDVVVGWVKNGATHFADYHTTGHRPPIVDKSQDWFLLHGEENDFGTVLKFVRKIDTCDSAEDMVIQAETVRIIYAYSDRDPTDQNSLNYHGPTTRGTRSLSLLSAAKVPTTLDPDVRHYEFLNQNFIVPNDTTTYTCTGFQMPDLGGKHHMVKYEAVVTPGNELMVHHILMYRCKGIAASYDGKQGHCYDHTRPMPQCSDVIMAWAIGGRPFYFPEKAGFSVGGPDDPTFYIMETHFDNPDRKTGVIDDSGIRISITKNLRPIDLGMLEMGMTTNYYQVIPPQQEAFVSKGYCSSGCVSQSIQAAKVPEINIVGVLQHAHLLGVGIKTRHFRNGQELEPLADDPNYDFDFQEMRVLKKERTVRPGDSFSIECTYDSRGRSRPTYGGLSTQEEMCLTFAYYYPKTPMTRCVSHPTYGLSQHGTQLYNLAESLDYSKPHVLAQFKDRLENSTVVHMCHGSRFQHANEVFVERETSHPYVAPPSDCSTK